MIESYIINLLFFIVYCLNIKKVVHIFQLKDYSTLRYLKFFKWKFIANLLLCTSLILSLLFADSIFQFCYISVVLFVDNFYFAFSIKGKKTPFVKTSKAKRLIGFSIFVLFALSFIPFLFTLFPFIFVFVPVISNIINFIDRNKNKQFIATAQNKLKYNNIKIIAITGSNGKTSVKNILLKMLETKYKTQATPSSYNTPLGISKFINNELKNDTEFLILEYGARHKNDVLELCNLFGADYGIITSIAPQHLETFNNIKNIVYAKSQLSAFLKNRLCVFNLDNAYCEKMYNEKFGLKVGISISKKNNIYASNIKIKNGKTLFKLHIAQNTFDCETQLLGKHNITNILLGLAISLELGVSIDKLLETISSFKPVPHRLQLIKTHINILDDSYNCSIESAKQAAWVLNQFKGKKMIVTPGIIEGGKHQQGLNCELGKLCSFADFCVVVGNTNKKAILEGLKSQNFSDKNIIFAKSLDEAKRYFTLLSNNDTLLLLNDLPDDYN